MTSLLSVHMKEPDINLDDLIASGVKVVKTLSDAENKIKTLRDAGIEVIRRECFKGDDDYRNTTPEMFFERLPKKTFGLGVIHEGINEPIVANEADAIALNKWWVDFAQLMHDAGERVIGFSWSTGNPTAVLLPRIVPLLVEAAAAVDLHGFHEYYNLENGMVDWGGYGDFEILLPESAQRPVIITECGIDERGDPNTSGWRGRVSESQYLDILKKYDKFLWDSGVCAATVYTWGDSGWPSFEIAPIARPLLAYIRAQGGGVAIPWQAPAVVPVEPPIVEEPIYELSLDKSSVTVGDTVTVSWHIENIKAAWLDGVPITGPRGSRQYALMFTPYSNILLTVDLPDGRTADKLITVRVLPAPVITPPQGGPMPIEDKLKAFPYLRLVRRDTSRGGWELTDLWQVIQDANDLLYVRAYNADGSPALGKVGFVALDRYPSWDHPDNTITQPLREIDEPTGKKAGTEFAYDAALGKGNTAGPHIIAMEGNSDRVEGLGAVWSDDGRYKLHTEWWHVFKWNPGTEPPTLPPGDYVTHAELEAALRAERQLIVATLRGAANVIEQG